MKKNTFGGLGLVIMLVIVTITASASMPAFDPVSSSEQIAQVRAERDGIYSDLSSLWEYYVDDYSNVTDEDQLLYTTLTDKIRILYYADDWQALKDDLQNCYKQKYEQHDPSWESYQAILRKEYTGITQAREGFPPREQIQLLINDYLNNTGFNRADLPNFSCYYTPYYEAYRSVCTVVMGIDTKSMYITFTPDTDISGHTSEESYELKITNKEPTAQEQLKAESIAKEFLEKYPHPFGTAIGETKHHNSMGKIGDDNVVQLGFFMGSYDGKTLENSKTDDKTDDKYAYFMVGLDSRKIYMYESLATLGYFE